MIITSIEPTDNTYKFVESCLDAYEHSLDENYMYLIEEAEPNQFEQIVQATNQYSNPFSAVNAIDKINKATGDEGMPSRYGTRQIDKVKAIAFWNHKNTKRFSKALPILTAGGAFIYDKYKDKSKPIIAKKIAALRKLFYKYQKRLQGSSPKEQNLIKRICANILNTINRLLKKISS